MSLSIGRGHAAIARGFRSLAGLLCTLAHERRGGTAIFVALAIIPLVAFVGLAVDTTRGYLVKSRLNQALDAAALAGGRVYANATRDDDIRMYFSANFPDGYLGAVTSPVEITPDDVNKTLTVSAQATLPTTFVRLLNFDSFTVASSAQVIVESQNVEVAMVLDITGSMSGQKIIDLRAAANDLVDIVVKDEQTPFYSKVALVPFSQGVNVGVKADQIRGPLAVPVAITNITKSSTATVTAPGHGFITGDKVFISGVGGLTAANNSTSATGPTSNPPSFWVVQKINDDQFSLRKCSTNSNCGSTTSVSSSTWSGTYVANSGVVHCTSLGCGAQAFINASGSWKAFLASSCVTERLGAEAYTDAAPSSAPVGRNYPDPGNSCVSNQIVPLSSSKTDLHAKINDLEDGGSTAGQIGTAWGWYMLSPNFSYLWPDESQPAAYGTPKLLKVAIIMTDGDFNTIYYNGVIAQNAGTGSGGNSVHINQNATNGNGYTQALALCTAMKAPGKDIEIYTVGFDLANATNGANAANFLSQCASSSSHVYLPESGADLQEAFHDIAQKISKLRLTK